MTHDSTLIGTAGGTFLALITIPTQTIATTIICAIIGAVTSYVTMILIKGMVSYIKYKYFNKEKNG